MNRVFYHLTNIELTPEKLAREANQLLGKPILTAWDYDPANPKSRIAGPGHCYCGGDGEFDLLPITHPDVQAGGKRYMECRKCGGWSHL